MVNMLNVKSLNDLYCIKIIEGDIVKLKCPKCSYEFKKIVFVEKSLTVQIVNI